MKNRDKLRLKIRRVAAYCLNRLIVLSYFLLHIVVFKFCWDVVTNFHSLLSYHVSLTFTALIVLLGSDIVLLAGWVFTRVIDNYEKTDFQCCSQNVNCDSGKDCIFREEVGSYE